MIIRFAFAEAANEDIVKKAIETMDEKEIDGRRMRVRGSKVITTLMFIGVCVALVFLVL